MAYLGVLSRSDNGESIPSILKLNAFRKGKGVLNFDSEILDGTIDFLVTKKKLNCPKISCLSIDKSSFCPP